MPTGQRTVEFFIYVLGNMTDIDTFFNTLSTNMTNIGYTYYRDYNRATFTKIGNYGTMDEHTEEEIVYPFIDSAFIAGLKVSSTIEFGNVNWS